METPKKKTRPNLDPNKLRPISEAESATRYGAAYAKESQRRAEMGDFTKFS